MSGYLSCGLGGRVISRLPDGKRTVECSGGVVVLRWSPGAAIDEQDARAAMSLVCELCEGRDRPVLVKIPGIRWVDHAARTVLAGPWPVARVAILGASPVDRVMVRFWQARHSPAYPTRLFTSAREAMSWLHGNAISNEAGAPAGVKDEPE